MGKGPARVLAGAPALVCAVLLGACTGKVIDDPYKGGDVRLVLDGAGGGEGADLLSGTDKAGTDRGGKTADGQGPCDLWAAWTCTTDATFLCKASCSQGGPLMSINCTTSGHCACGLSTGPCGQFAASTPCGTCQKAVEAGCCKVKPRPGPG